MHTIKCIAALFTGSWMDLSLSLSFLWVFSLIANRHILDHLKRSSLPRLVCHWLVFAERSLLKCKTCCWFLRSMRALLSFSDISVWSFADFFPAGVNLKTGAIGRGLHECVSVACDWNCSQTVRLRGQCAGPMGLCYPAAQWWRALGSAHKDGRSGFSPHTHHFLLLCVSVC